MIDKFLKRIIEDKSVHKIQPSSYREKIYKHLIRLSPEDRYLRFGITASNESIRKYVDGISDDDTVFVIYNGDMHIVAMAHLSVEKDKVAELGFSVNKEYRKRNYATRLFNRALVTAKILRIKELIIVFLPENRAMRESAKKFRMRIQNEDGDMKGRRRLTEASPIEFFEYVIAAQTNVLDFVVKANISQFRLLKRVLTIESKKGK
jgi:predicted acetyltransferase